MGWRRRGEFARFLAGGVGNTLATYGLYLSLLAVIGYQIAYALAYVAGILLSYWINLKFVFRRQGGGGKLLRFPLVYLTQYAVGAGVLWAAVDGLGVPASVGPALAVAVTVPFTFVLSRWVLTRDGGEGGNGAEGCEGGGGTRQRRCGAVAGGGVAAEGRASEGRD
jgi:putative flippase GtrA